jgi:hyaluronoglucosaminidase
VGFVAWEIRGLIEGFYGRPWTWDERFDVMAWCAARGMTHYLYAPKDDPLHRDRWREPYPDEAMNGFERLVGSGTLEVGFGIAPGLSIDYESTEDRLALQTKIEQLLDVGVRFVALALDDIPPEVGLGERHAVLTAWLYEQVAGRADLVLVPTEYTGTVATPYLDALHRGVPADVPIAWTGDTVVCDAITVAQAEARSAALGGRAPLIWDNYPVNDAVMADRMFLGPLRGREPGLADVCSGYVANPMVQPAASKLPLASAAGLLRGEDPESVWAAEADAMGIRTFAEACDGMQPRVLVEAVRTSSADDRDPALDRIDAWLDDLRNFAPDPRLAEEVEPWRVQAELERGVWRAAVRLLRALDRGEREAATTEGMGLLYRWPAARRGQVSVMGPRCSFRPVFGQWPDGSWRFDAASVQEDMNATDTLVRLALAELAGTG